jgi:hypothetical protein
MSTLLVKTVTGFVFLMLILALALFIPAGSLDYWQAWVYLAVWAVCVILITAYLIKNDRALLAGRVQAGPVAGPKRVRRLFKAWPAYSSSAYSSCPVWIIDLAGRTCHRSSV